jgi:hypothetical protein
MINPVAANYPHSSRRLPAVQYNKVSATALDRVVAAPCPSIAVSETLILYDLSEMALLRHIPALSLGGRCAVTRAWLRWAPAILLLVGSLSFQPSYARKLVTA